MARKSAVAAAVCAPALSSCNIVVHYPRAISLCTIVVHYRRAMSLCTIVVHYRRAISLRTIVVQHKSTKTSLLAALASGLQDLKQMVVKVLNLLAIADRATVLKGRSGKMTGRPKERHRVCFPTFQDLLNATRANSFLEIHTADYCSVVRIDLVYQSLITSDIVLPHRNLTQVPSTLSQEVKKNMLHRGECNGKYFHNFYIHTSSHVRG